MKPAVTVSGAVTTWSWEYMLAVYRSGAKAGEQL